MKKPLNSLCIISLATLISCAEVKKFGKKSDKMLKQSKNIYKLSTQSAQNLCHAFLQGRQGNSSGARNEYLKTLKDKETDYGTKLIVGGKFVQALEFQLFTKNCEEQNGDQQELIKLSLAEFFKALSTTHSSLNNKVSPLKVVAKKKFSNEQAFSAIALNLHAVNRMQEYNSKNSNITKLSLLEIIEDTITKEANGEAVPAYAQEILIHSNKNIIISLLQYRMNYLATLGLKDLVEKEDMTFKEKGRALLKKITKRWGKIEMRSKYLNRNNLTQEKINTYLLNSLKAADLLSKIGVTPEMHPELSEIFYHLDIESEKNESLSGPTKNNYVLFLGHLNNINNLKKLN